MHDESIEAHHNVDSLLECVKFTSSERKEKIMIDLFLEPLNNMAMQLFKLIGISLTAYLIIYLIVKSLSASSRMANSIGFLAFAVTFYYALFNIFLPGLQYT